MLISYFKAKSPTRNHMLLLIFIWFVYALLVFLSPADEAVNRYNLSFVQLEIIRIAFLLPNLLIWLTAGYAVVSFHKYALLVKGSAESRSFSRIAHGLMLLLLALIVPPFITITSSWLNIPTQTAFTVLVNYVHVFFYLGSFWYLWMGSKDLVGTLGLFNGDGPDKKYIPWFIGVLTIAYVYSIFQNQFRTHSADPLIRSTYYLPDWLIITTIVIPYVMIWFWGLTAVVNLREYSKRVGGSVYKKAFSYISNGLIATIGLSISLQFLSQLAEFFGKTSLSIILLIIFLIILVMAIGYFFIARGVKELTAIEEF